MNILFTICGRAGSKGFKNKNLKSMRGVPLVCYTIAAIALYADKHPENNTFVALNTDSSELQRIVKDQSIYGGIVFVDRKKELAGDKVAKVDVIRDTYITLRQVGSFDIVIDLDLTSPLRTVTDIENAIKVYSSGQCYDIVFSVVEARRSPYFNMVERKDSYYNKICNSTFVTRQEAPQSYELNASIYIYNPSFLEKRVSGTILDQKCGISIMKDYLVLDIDSEEDFEMMKFLHGYYCDNEPGILEIYERAKN